MSEAQSNREPVKICFPFPLFGNLIEGQQKRRACRANLSMTSCHSQIINALFFLLPGLVEAWTSPQAEFGLLPAIRSLWYGFKPSVSKLCRAGQRHCSTSRPRAGLMVLSPDNVWKQRRGGQSEQKLRAEEENRCTRH